MTRQDSITIIQRLFCACLGALVFLSSLAMLAADGRVSIPDRARSWLSDHNFSSEARLEWQATDRAHAVAIYTRLLQRDPANPYRWCDLAEALQEEGRSAEAAAAFYQATLLGPAIPPVLIRSANFHVANGEDAAAAALYRSILSMVHDYDPIVFLILSRTGLPVRQITATALPSDAETARHYLEFLLKRGDADELADAWSWMSAKKIDDDSAAAAYVEFLLTHSRTRHAAEVWAGHLGQLRGNYLRTNFIYNSGFQNSLKPSRFDWRIETLDGAETTVESPGPASGERNVRIRFTGEANVSYRQLTQIIVPPPGTYRFHARIKTEGVTTLSGVQFHVFDPSRKRFEWFSRAYMGTRPWIAIEEPLHIPPVPFLVVEVLRQASTKFDGKIHGTVWIDDVELVRSDGAENSQSRVLEPRDSAGPKLAPILHFMRLVPPLLFGEFLLSSGTWA
jgi:hypothetical protein